VGQLLRTPFGRSSRQRSSTCSYELRWVPDGRPSHTSLDSRAESSRSRTILWSAEARGQETREHGTHAHPACVSRLPAAENRTSQIRCISKVRDDVARSGRRYVQVALGSTLPGRFGKASPPYPTRPRRGPRLRWDAPWLARVVHQRTVPRRGRWVRSGRLIMGCATKARMERQIIPIPVRP